MAVDLPSGPLDNHTWTMIQSAIIRRDDAQNYPAILLYPHDGINPEDVEEELLMLRKVLGRCPYTLARDTIKERSGEPVFVQKSVEGKVKPAGRFCDIAGHCFPSIDSWSDEKPDIAYLKSIEAPHHYDYEDWLTSDFDKGQMDIIKELSMGDRDWHDAFLNIHESKDHDLAGKMFSDQLGKWHSNKTSSVASDQNS